MGSGCSQQNGKSHLPFLSLKMVLIGAPGVGKSSVFKRVTANQFSHNYDETTSVRIGNIVKKINVPVDCAISIALWDLPGQEDVDIRKSYFEDIDGAILVVNINDVDNMRQVPLYKADLLHLTTTKSDLATYNTPSNMEQVKSEEELEDIMKEKVEEEKGEKIGEGAEMNYIGSDPSLHGSFDLKDIPLLVLGNKVDELHIDKNQTELHNNVILLKNVSDQANCSGWVPVSAKDNDRSIDLAYTSFLRYLVERKLQLIKEDNKKVKGLEQVKVCEPAFLPPRTAATRIRAGTPEEEDENAKKLPLAGEEELDREYQVMRKVISKVERGYNDWNIAYRRFRKTTVEYKIVQSTGCSVEEIVLNLKERLSEPQALKVEKFQGWIKLVIDEDITDSDDIEDEILEVIDSFNYDLVPNANFVAVSVREAQVTLTECQEKIESLFSLGSTIPESCLDQVRQNTSTIHKYMKMCEECISAVQRLRSAIELAVLW